MASFPPRTAASDAIARNLFLDLQANAVANGGVNRCMVTVVVTGDRDIPTAAFIAASGPGLGGGLRTAINNLQGNGIYGGVAYTLVAYTRNTNLIRPPNFLPGVAPAPVPFLLPNARDCAEPKALEAAAQTGDRLSGMSTFWWGNIANAHPHPNPDPLGIVPWAQPCDVCATNENNIMLYIEQLRLNSRSGVPMRAFEV